MSSTRPGRVRPARLTDLAALGELSRLAHPAPRDGAAPAGPRPTDGIDGQVPRIRSLGLPLTAGHVSVFSLFLMPLGAFQPHDQLYVYEEDGRLAGLARVERDAHRDEWTVVELDAVDNGDAGDIRYRLIQHLLRDGSRRGAARFHVACADRGGNVELFMQAGFARYGEESVLYRDPDAPFPSVRSVDPAAAGIRPALPNDAIALGRLYRTATPAPVARLEDYHIPDWEHIGSRAGVPRTSLTPLLRFADLEAFVQETTPGPSGDGLVAFLHLGVAKEHQPHYLRVVTVPDHDPTDLIRFGLATIGARVGGERARRTHGHGHGVMSCVRTYEAPLDRRLEEQGLSAVATVSLLMKEALVRVAEPAMVPAIR
jgi:hypothetical protein